jgi:disulfide oxidoreductase YuzD
MQVTVYGADTPCPSCVHSPTSKETMEWLEAAIRRKFPKAELDIRYVDLDYPETEEDQSFTQKIKNDDYFYPLIVADGHILGEGDPRLKPIFEYLESKGFAD